MYKEDIIHKKSVAYASLCGGVEIKAIQYGIEYYIEFVSEAWTGHPTPHVSKIHYDGERPYFKCRGYKVYLDDCIRM